MKIDLISSTRQELLREIDVLRLEVSVLQTESKSGTPRRKKLKIQDTPPDSILEELKENLLQSNKEIAILKNKIQQQAEDIFAGEQLLVERTIETEKEKEFINSLIESQLNSIFFALDTDFRYKRFSNSHKQTMKSLWGTDIETGMNMLDVIVEPDDRERAKNNFERVLKGENIRFEEEYGDRNLNRAYFESIYNPIRNSDGEIIGLTVFVLDISERKQREKLLKESEEKYHSLFNANKDGISVALVNGDGTTSDFVIVNNAATEIIGYSREELLTMKMADLENEVSGEERNRRLEVLQSSGVIDFETTVKHKGGHSINVGIRTVLVEYGNRPAVMCIARDISKNVQDKKEMLRLYQAMWQMPVSVLITNPDGDIEYVNLRTTELTGYSSEELIGKNPRILSYGDMPKERYSEMWDTITSGNKWHGEFHNKSKNGTQFLESASISPIIDEENKITHYLGIKVDITERKVLLAELVESKEKAELSAKLIESFIGNISHEIRTPLNGILGMAHIIQETYSLPKVAEDERIFTSLERSSKRLINTIDQILIYSRLQVGDYPLRKCLVSIDEILQTLILKYKELATSKNIQINSSDMLAEVTVFADYNSLLIAFDSVIGNAVKYTRKGFIDITITKDESNNPCITIRDTGIGIAVEYLEHLFQPYTQEEIGFCRPYEGLGLGLSLAKKLFNLCDATIAVESKKNEGTVFTVSFANQDSGTTRNPRTEDEGSDIQQGQSSGITNREIESGAGEEHSFPIYSFRAGTKPKILIVEDDDANQYFIEKILSQAYETATVNNSRSALELLAQCPFDLILMDISIKKGMNGLQLTQFIREGARNPNIPIIVVSGHEASRFESQAAGSDAFLAKPFIPSELIEKISKFIKILPE